MSEGIAAIAVEEHYWSRGCIQGLRSDSEICKEKRISYSYNYNLKTEANYSLSIAEPRLKTKQLTIMP